METAKLNRYGYNTLARQLVFAIIVSVILFVAAGTLDWYWGWVFSIVHFGSWLGLSIAMGWLNPALTNERGRPTSQFKDMKSWDKVILGLYTLAMLAQPIAAGLDYRFGWSGDWGLWAYILGNLLIILSFVLLAWSMVVNRHFDAIARIQSEKDEHRVISAGPYAYVRHPGYLAVVIGFIAQAIALSSWAALLVGIFGAALFIIRTSLEDKLLQEELGGYKEFAQQTRFRLFPMLW